MRKGVSALEDFIEGRVRERLEHELKGMLDRLEQNLPRGEFVRVLEIVANEEDGHGD
jgi:hypothetical protein